MYSYSNPKGADAEFNLFTHFVLPILAGGSIFWLLLAH